MNDYYPTAIEQRFNKWASLYPIVDLLTRGIREKVFYFVSPRKGAKILDVCTGTGKQAFAFGRRGFDVTGIDLSLQMLKIAVRENGYKKVRFGVGNAEKLPLRENHFDICCISFGLHEMPYCVRKKVIGEMVRVTKPQGKIIIVDYALSSGKIKNFLFYHFVRLYESKYFPEFIKTDLQDMINEMGLKFEGCRELAGDGVRVWKYQKV